MGHVYTPTSNDIPLAAHTMVKAFTGDPFNEYFYNFMPDQLHPPRGTQRMTALEIYNHMKDAIVLAVDDSDRKCAGVSLWVPPRIEPLGWLESVGKWLRMCAFTFMDRIYYHNRGINRKVGLFLNKMKLM